MAQPTLGGNLMVSAVVSGCAGKVPTGDPVALNGAFEIDSPDGPLNVLSQP